MSTKKILFTFALLFAMSAMVALPSASTSGAQPGVAGDHSRYIVTFNGDTAAASLSQLVASLGGTVEMMHAQAGIAIVIVNEDAAPLLASSEGVDIVEKDVIVQLDPPPAVSSAGASDVSIASATDPTTAYFYSRQWNLRAIFADQAWAAGRLGSAEVTVAILDTGISYTHIDLVGRVDLSRSVSFVPSDDALVAAYFPGYHPVTDLNYHGTHVAATVSSNAVGAAGVTSKVTLIGVKVLNVNNIGYHGRILSGVLYAADNGADVINMSIVGGDTKDHNGHAIAGISRVFNYAHRKGALVVVCAGNDSLDLDHDGNYYHTYCSAPNVVCVSATGPTASGGYNGPFTNVDAFAPYSNYGRSAISVAAPGGAQGYVWEACSRTSLVVPYCQTWDYVIGMTGTSMAAPHVSGLAALLVEQIGHGKPSQIKAALQRTADDLGQVGTDPFYGKGRINVPRALGLP